jgi:hypothetical protein
MNDYGDREQSMQELFGGRPANPQVRNFEDDDEDGWGLNINDRGRHGGDYDGDIDDALLLHPAKRKRWYDRVLDFLRAHWRPQVLAVLFILFLAEAARGIVLPTISTYVDKARPSTHPFFASTSFLVRTHSFCHRTRTRHNTHTTLQVGGDKSQLGLAISLFSVGRLVGAPVLGWWYSVNHFLCAHRTCVCKALRLIATPPSFFPQNEGTTSEAPWRC